MALCLWDILSCDVVSVGHFVLWRCVCRTFCHVMLCLWDILSCGVVSVGHFVM